jgi:hypothetical protein
VCWTCRRHLAHSRGGHGLALIDDVPRCAGHRSSR